MYLRLIIFISALAICYFLGASQCHNKIVTTTLKEVRYVQKQTATIQAMPHANRSDLLELMRNGTL